MRVRIAPLCAAPGVDETLCVKLCVVYGRALGGLADDSS